MSKHNARPCHLDWIRSIVTQCKMAGVPCFVKQLGSVPMMSDAAWRAKTPTRLLNHCNANRIPSDCAPIYLQDRKGGDPAEWPEDLRVREMPNV